MSVVSCTGWGRFLWGDSCKDEFLDEEVLTWRSLVLEARWSFDAVWGGEGGILDSINVRRVWAACGRDFGNGGCWLNI